MSHFVTTHHFHLSTNFGIILMPDAYLCTFVVTGTNSPAEGASWCKCKNVHRLWAAPGAKYFVVGGIPI